MNNSLKTRVEVKNLLKRLYSFRQTHLEEYDVTRASYLDNLQEALEEDLADVRNDKIPNLNIVLNIPTPFVKKDSYDNAIAMLEATVEETIELNSSDFSCLHENKWDWAQRFNDTSVSNKLQSYKEQKPNG